MWELYFSTRHAHDLEIGVNWKGSSAFGRQRKLMSTLIDMTQPLTTMYSCLQSFTFGWNFDQSMDNGLPSGLQSLTFSWNVYQSMDNVLQEDLTLNLDVTCQVLIFFAISRLSLCVLAVMM